MPDPDGQELPDLDAARQQAVEGVQSILSDEVTQGLLDLTGYVEIADADQKVLAVVRFIDAISLRLPNR